MSPKSTAVLSQLLAVTVFSALSAASGLLAGEAQVVPPVADRASGQAIEFLAKADQRPDVVAPFALEVVVRFKDDGKVKDIVDAFWRDPQAAKAKFDLFKQGRPDMSAAKLDRVTYSNELVLIYPCAAVSKSERARVTREIISRFSASPDIAYAEPAMTVQPQQ
jgi:hypothetical protein